MAEEGQLCPSLEQEAFQMRQSELSCLPELQEPANAAEQPIDVLHLRRYTLGDEALEKEVLDLFFAQLPETIAALRAADGPKDRKRAAHTLKGSGRAVGAWSLARLAEVAETTVANEPEAGLDGLIAEIEKAAAAAEAFVTEVYAGLDPVLAGR
jgi:HPt (histidine-containing phosphotransfer) domain-containing protein